MATFTGLLDGTAVPVSVQIAPGGLSITPTGSSSRVTIDLRALAAENVDAEAR